jgi:hypothetical protein
MAFDGLHGGALGFDLVLATLGFLFQLLQCLAYQTLRE